jgi:nitrate/TMAO reductase-like tetraheme cytochrome c subunit
MMGSFFRHFLIISLSLPSGARSDSLFRRYLNKLLDYTAVLGDFRTIFDHIGTIFQNPRNYSRELVILIAILFLIFLLILLLAMLVLALKRQLRIRKTYGAVTVKITKKQFVRFSFFAFISLTALAAIFAASVSTPSMCGQCHVINKPYNQWRVSTHKSITCTGCHYEPGIYGYISGSFHGSENLIAFIFKAPSTLQSTVLNKTCLNCHYDVKRKSLTGERQILVKHKEIIQAGLSCVECHGSVAHKQKSEKTFVMNICIRCHNGDKASAKCTTCHQKDIAYKPHTTLDDWPKVKNARIICAGCHTTKTDRSCITCHEVELPHPDEFRRTHAMQAEAKKDLCYKCHWKTMPKKEMCACHKEGNVHGNPEKWYFKHRKTARINGIGCNCHTPAYCGRCHNDPNSIYPSGYTSGLQNGMH